MRSLSRIALMLTVILLSGLSLTAPAYSDIADFAPYNSFPHLIPEINNFSGSANQRIPIAVPPGRNGIQPALAFSYSSYQQNGWLGVGWQIPVDAIQRRSKIDVHYDLDEFELISAGGKVDLVPVDNDQFRARIESDFSQYAFNRAMNYWVVTHKDGTKYYYGYSPQNNNSLQSCQSNTFGTFKWSLAQVEDTNGNYLTIEYLADAGQIYPQQVDYTGNSITGTLPSNKVVFTYSSSARQDAQINYRYKSAVETALLLDTVTTYAQNDSLALEYRLEYEQSPAGGRTRLKTIRIVGSDSSTQLPPYRFDYTDGGPPTMSGGTAITIPYGSRCAFGDVNGDGLDDLIRLVSDYAAYPTKSIACYLSLGDGSFSDTPSTTIDGLDDNDENEQFYVIDMNGDGWADLVTSCKHELFHGDNSCWNHLKTTVYLSNGDGTFGDGNAYVHEYEGTGKLGFIDHNRDGHLDIVHEDRILYSDTEGGFTDPESFIMPINSFYSPAYFADVNGDGFTDIIQFGSTLWSEGEFITFLSNGHGGFEEKGSSSFLDMGVDDFSQISFVDINSDSRADLLVISYKPDINPAMRVTAYTYFYDEDEGFTPYNQWPTGITESQFNNDIIHLADINGDNQLDVIIEHDGSASEPKSADNQLDPAIEEDDYASESEKADSQPDPVIEEDGYVSEKGTIIVISDDNLTTRITQQPAPFDLLHAAQSPSGASISYDYRQSTESQNHFLPFLLYPVASVSVEDGVNDDPSINRYTHEWGYYDAAEREFSGFEKSIRTHPDGSMTYMTHYVGRPDNPNLADDNYYRKGRIKQIQRYEIAGSAPGLSLLSQTDYTWDVVEDSSDPWAFVKVSQVRTAYYDGITVSTQQDFEYDDTNGNLRYKTESGTDASSIVTEYGYTNYGSDAWNPIWRKTLEKVYYQGEDNDPARHFAYVHDETNGNLLQKIGKTGESGDSVWRYDYWENGNLRYEYDANGHDPTEYAAYDATQTYSTVIRNALGHEVRKTWDTRWGAEDRVVDPNNQATEYTYDQFGRLIRTDYPDDGYTEQAFNDYCADATCANVGLPRMVLVSTRTTGSETQDTRVYFDGLARKVQTSETGEEAGQFIVGRTHYDNMGRTAFEAGPFFRSADTFLDWDPGKDAYETHLSAFPYVDNTYDARGRITKVSSWDGQNGAVTTKYDYSGFATTITDPDGCVKQEVRDHLGRIIEVVEDPDGEDLHTRYLYNAAGDLERVQNALYDDSDPNANRLEIEYDAIGRKTGMDDPDMGSWTYSYYPNGELEQQTDANGQSIQFTYDAINRAVSKTYQNAVEPTPNVTYSYDQGINGIGLPYRTTNGDVTTTVTAYDPMGRETEVQKAIIGAATRTMSWTYDYAGRIQRLTYPHTDASPIFYVDYAFYSGTGLLHSATGSDGTVYATMTGYQPSGKIGSLDFGNDAQAIYAYDGWTQRLTAYRSAMDQGTGSTIQDRAYGYSRAGDINTIDDLAWVETYFYTYDKLHRLTSETTSAGSAGVIPGIFDMQYDDPTHIHAVSQVSTRGTDHVYGYDANGNMIAGPDLTDTLNVAERTLTFNADNMPTSVTHTTGGTILITYDGDGQRAKKEGLDSTTYYFSDVFEKIADAEVCYVFAGNLRVAMVKNYSEVVYFHKDHLGSTSAISDPDGNIVEETRYMPFGGTRGASAGLGATNYRFTDQELDPSSGLYNYGARLYDPMIGRFASADILVANPHSSQGYGRYAYVSNNPLIFVDPTGHYKQNSDGSWDIGTITCTAKKESNGAEGVGSFAAAPVAAAPFTWPSIQRSLDELVMVGLVARAPWFRALLGAINLSTMMEDGEDNIDKWFADEEDEAKSDELEVDEAKDVPKDITPSPALTNNPYSPGEVSKRQSGLREKLGLNKDPDTQIPDQSPGKNIKDGVHSSDGKTRHSTGERNVSSKEEHSRVAKATGGRGSRY